jgi:hypothetical protein
MATQYAFATLVSGTSFHSMFTFCSFMGFDMPSESTFYKAQRRIVAFLESAALESCAYFASLVRHGKFAFDGSWSHCRRAPQCFGCLIDLVQRKVVQFCFWPPAEPDEEPGAEGKSGGKGPPKGGDESVKMCAIASQAMEGECFRKMAEFWAGNPSVDVLATDADNQLNGIMTEVGWSVLAMLGRNHVVKDFDRHTSGSASRRIRLGVDGVLTWGNSRRA